MAQNINSKEHWDNRWVNSPSRSKKCEKIICRMVEPNLSVLDIGCGGGYLLKILKDRCTVYGIDISSVSIDLLKISGIDGEIWDAENMDRFNKLFDVVICSHTLEHITDDIKLIKNIRRITKKYAIFAVPNNCIGPEEEPEHQRIYTKESLTELLFPHFKVIEDFSNGNHLILKCSI